MTDDEVGMPPVGGQALTNWRLANIESKLDSITTNYVPVNIYNVNQQNIATELARLNASDVAQSSKREALELKVDTQRNDIDKQRKQFWTSVATGGLLLVIGIFITPIAQALGLTQ